MKRTKLNSSEVLNEIYDELYDRYKDEGLTRDEIKEFYEDMFFEYKKVFREEDVPVVRIPCIGTFMPIPGRIEDRVNDIEYRLSVSDPQSEDYEELEKEYNKLKKEHKRVKKLMKTYNKHNGNTINKKR